MLNKSPLKLSLLAGFLFFANPVAADNEIWSEQGFEQPESVIFHKGSNHLFVSNIAGSPAEKNAKGYISKLSADGKIVMQKWATGMDAPKGMAIAKDKLYVSDIDKIHVIEIATGEIVKTHKEPNAKFLNDLSATDNGRVFISDMVGHGIYEVTEKGLSLWLASDQIQHPNGLLVKGNDLYIATWGTDMQDDFSTKTPGSLYKVNLTSKEITLVKGAEHMGNLDGVVAMGDQFLINDWITGDLFVVTPGQPFKKIATFKPGLADIANHGDTLYMPYMMDNKVEALKIKQPLL
ncbi:hypothetical protein RYZ26_05625 [Terasakiella sp. A23]|uniref:SMP-30/gluconolactonase/LRE family protein n=1 Tax=Terasakiella sp. FCG-A23 TaxID=3080561 RepID=UPI0029550DB4|nr:hypothetical protein [Terasakiella sp. A23]MDV7339061.1 hypothetical protein [Terasakiella sp. A23]